MLNYYICQQTQANTPRLKYRQPKAGYLPRSQWDGIMEGWVDLGDLIAIRSGIELATALIERLDWIEQCFTSPPTQYRLYGRRFLQVKRPNQQYQSTVGTNSTQTNQTYNKQTWTQNTASPLVYNNMGWLVDGFHRAGLRDLNGGGAAAAVPPLWSKVRRPNRCAPNPDKTRQRRHMAQDRASVRAPQTNLTISTIEKITVTNSN